MRRQLRYLPEAEKIEPAATRIFMRHSCRATQTISTCSGNSIHSKNPPFGRVIQISQENIPVSSRYKAPDCADKSAASAGYGDDSGLPTQTLPPPLRGRHIKTADGVFHMHQFIVITPRCDPTHAQARAILLLNELHNSTRPSISHEWMVRGRGYSVASSP